MDTNLTPDELAFAHKYIRRLKKSFHGWTWVRWFILAMSIVVLGGGLGGLVYLGHAVNTELVNNSMQDRPFLDTYFKNFILMKHMEIYVLSIMSVLSGIFMVSYALVNWNSYRRNRLFAKLLQSYIDQII